jgi:hypothetical protein
MLVQSCVINIDAPDICVLLWDVNWIGNPTRCFYFLDEPDIFQSMKFCWYCFLFWLIKSLKRLLYKACFGIHI